MESALRRQSSLGDGGTQPSPLRKQSSMGAGGTSPSPLRKQSSMNSGILSGSITGMEEKSHAFRKQSAMLHNGEVTIKLSKGGTAHRKVYDQTSKQERDELLSRLADIIKDSNDHAELKTTKGKLPIEAAYTVMKRVTEAAKVPILPVGMSTFNKLESLRTDPALRVLSSTSWKDFFSKPMFGGHGQQSGNGVGSGGVAGGPSTATGGTNSTGGTQPVQNAFGGTTNIHDPDEVDPMLDLMFDNLIVRVEFLWRQLKIPKKEQQFYLKSLCKRPISSMEQCKELASYIEKLEEHKVATKHVIKMIEHREVVVKKAYDVITALHRKFTKPSNSLSNGSQYVVEITGNQTFWKEELIISLDEVRCATLEVIKSVQLWRKSMWRPHGFYYKEINYFYKMKEDMKLLESDIILKIFESIPLLRDDLLCILFFHVDNFYTSQQGKSMSMRSFIRANNQAHSGNSGGPMDGNEYIDNLLKEFLHNIDREELKAAATVVLEEERLQQALATEQTALKSKGVFIPLLRPNNPAAYNGSNSPFVTSNSAGNSRPQTATSRPQSGQRSSGKQQSSFSPERDNSFSNFMPFGGSQD